MLENRDLVPDTVSMIQKEVAVRLAEPPGSKEYGILSVLQAWYDVELLRSMRRFSIRRPRSSAVIRLRNGVGDACDETLFVKVVASFGQRQDDPQLAAVGIRHNFGGAEHPFFTQRAERFRSPTSWS